MPERTGKLGQTLSMVLMLVVMAGVAIGLGVLMGRYVFDVFTGEPAADQGAAPGSTTTARDASQGATSSLESGAPAGESATATSSQQPTVVPPASAAGEAGAGTPQGAAGTSALHRVQVGEFADRAGADDLARELGLAGYPGFVTAGPPFRVQVGAFSERANADRLASELEQKGYSVIVLR